MKARISWKNNDITKLARRMIETMPEEMLQKVRDQMKTGANTRIHGLAEEICLAQSALPEQKRKIKDVYDQNDVQRLKTALTSIRSSNPKNYYQPKALTAKPKMKTKVAKAAKVASAPRMAATPKVLDDTIIKRLATFDDQLIAFGLTPQHRSKVLNQIVSCQ